MKKSSTIVLLKTLRYFAKESGLDENGEVDYEDVYNFLSNQLSLSTVRNTVLTLSLAYEMANESLNKQLTNGDDNAAQ